MIKVVDIEEDESGEQMFLVHYAGWNSRYDEWVKRSKIAENLSRSVRRAKNSPVKTVKAATTKRRPPPGATIRSEPARSTTPSSITSSSSRTKSPATPASGSRRSKRRERPATPGASNTGRRTRRISGHTDLSIDTDSESESVDSASDSEIKRDKAASDAASASDDSRKREPKKVETKLPVKRKPIRKDLDEPSTSVEVIEKKKPRLMRGSIVKNEKEETRELPIEKELKEEVEELPETQVKTEIYEGGSPKGRDFDLNEIRSELKGIDKAVKVSSELDVPEGKSVLLASSSVPLDVRLVPTVEDAEVKEEEMEMPVDHPEPIVEPQETEKPPPEPPTVQFEEKPPILEDVKEDIYEFKEPEPFDFQEVRRPIRIFDEPVERSPEKSLSVKKVNLASTSMRAIYDKIEKREVSPLEDVKSRFRKTIGKKLKEMSGERKDSSSDTKTDDEVSVIKEAPRLEVEEPPPPLVVVPIEKAIEEEEEVLDLEPLSPPRPHKSSPEPPCLIPVTETTPCRPPEHSPVLTREDPPRLDSDISSSDSESDERLVIVNEDESTTSCDVKVPPPPPPLPPPPESPPVLLVEEPPETDILKRLEERLKTPPSLSVEPVSPKTVPGSAEDKENTEEVEEEEDDEDDEVEGESNMRSLLCDEVIPGSPAPKEPGEELAFPAPSASGSGAAAVMENTPPTTPPTTPESNVSSPREDRVGSSLDNESSKSHRDSSEIDMDIESQRNRTIKFGKRCEKEPPDSPSKKRRRSRKRSDSTSEVTKRNPRGVLGRAKARDARDASDSDDTSENSLGLHGADALLSNRSPRPSKYNFCKELASDLDANQRIAFLQNQLQDLRKAYMNVKSQLASIDRRRKKLRRKEREEKAEKAAAAAAAKVQEATCS